MIERFPALSAFFVALVLIASVTYEWAYFGAVGTEWRSLLTPQDYLALVVEWIPGSIAAAAVGIGFNLFFTRIEGGKTEDEIATASSNPRFTKRFRKGADWALGGAVVLGMLTAIILGPSYYFKPAAAVIVAIIWFPVSQWIFSHEQVAKRYSAGAKAIAIFLPSVLLVVYSTGIKQGNADLRKRATLYQILDQDGAERLVGVLRSIERGLIVRDYGANQTYLAPWDTVKSLSSIVEPLSDKPTICKMFNLPICSIYATSAHENMNAETEKQVIPPLMPVR